MKKITSQHNPEIKAAARLRQRGEREATGCFLIEGTRELRRAVECGFVIQRVFACPELLDQEAHDILRDLKSRGLLPCEVNEQVFAKLAMRDQEMGLVAVAESRLSRLSDLRLGPNPIFLIVDGVEKPGNLGALLRTADAVGVAGVVLTNPVIDCFNPNVVRSSIGTIFSVPLAIASVAEVMEFCCGHEIQVIAAMPDTTKMLYEYQLNLPIAFLLGSEAHGLSQKWLAQPELARAKLPMLGYADSLNVSVAGAVMLYEALRQRLRS